MPTQNYVWAPVSFHVMLIYFNLVLYEVNNGAGLTNIVYSEYVYLLSVFINNAQVYFVNT